MSHVTYIYIPKIGYENRKKIMTNFMDISKETNNSDFITIEKQYIKEISVVCFIHFPDILVMFL